MRSSLVLLLLISPAWCAIEFGGVDDDIMSPSISHGIGTGDFTVAMWCYCRDLTGSYEGLAALGSYAPGFYSKTADGTEWGVYWSSAMGSGNILSEDTWYHLVFMRESGTLKFFQDGAQTGTTHSVSTSIANGTFMLGWDGGSQRLDGFVDDARFYDRALSSAEVSALYKSSRRTACKRTGGALATDLLVHWEMRDGEIGSDASGTDNIIDSSGNGNHGDGDDGADGSLKFSEPAHK